MKKILIIIGSILGGIIALFFIVALFLPSKTHVERSVVIDAPAEKVYAMVYDLKNNDLWMPWNKIDPNMEKTYSTPTSGVGAWYSWKSDNENVGVGKLTIVEAVPNESIKCELNFGEMGISYSSHKFETVENGTKVTWFFDSEMPYPVGRYFGLFMDKLIGPDYEKGLADMQKVVKEMPEPMAADTSSSMVAPDTLVVKE